MAEDLQSLCARGQAALALTNYIAAERILVDAEARAWATQDLDALARLYMPLQEARRQIRQRAGEGVVRQDLVARGPEDTLSAERIVEDYPHGQLLIAGWGSIAPAVEARRLAAERGLFLDVFLAAAYAVGESVVVLIVPTDDALLPPTQDYSIDRLIGISPAQALVVPSSDFVAGPRVGTPETFAETMALWEKLHSPFLAAADATTDLALRLAAYRLTIRVDPACELAHQHFSDTARELNRQRLKEMRMQNDEC